MDKERIRSFIAREWSLLLGIVGLGAVAGVLFSNSFGGSDLPFFNERVLLNPPSTVYAARGVSPDDHIWGLPTAPVVLIEYSDLECPYCKNYHFRMVNLVNEYQGKVAWVFRHHPLDHRFSRSRKEAEAAECAAFLGSNQGFWRYITRLYEITPSNNGLDPALLPQIAADVGLDRAAFAACLESGRFAERVDRDFREARAAGLSVTPSAIVLYGGDKRTLVVGSQSDETFRRIFDYLLSVSEKR